MSAFPATVGGLSVDIPVGNVRRALAIAELSGSDTVSITITLERLVGLTQTVACLVGQQLDEAVGQEKMSSDVEPGDGSGESGVEGEIGLDHVRARHDKCRDQQADVFWPGVSTGERG